MIRDPYIKKRCVMQKYTITRVERNNNSNNLEKQIRVYNELF